MFAICTLRTETNTALNLWELKKFRLLSKLVTWLGSAPWGVVSAERVAPVHIAIYTSCFAKFQLRNNKHPAELSSLPSHTVFASEDKVHRVLTDPLNVREDL